MAEDVEPYGAAGLTDRAAELMEEALALLDAAGANRAAALLDHALYAVPTAQPGSVRERISRYDASC